MKQVGFGGMDVEDLIKFRIHKVTPIHQVDERGFATLTEDQLVKLRIQPGAQFVKMPVPMACGVSPNDAVDLASMAALAAQTWFLKELLYSARSGERQH